MSVQNAKACIEKLRSDPGFGKKLEAAPNDAARVKIMKDAGFDFSKEEFKQVVKEMAPSQELSEKDLEAVAGGSSGSWVSMGTSTGVAAGTAAAAF